ncbi:MAG TPA: hypothetical protein VNM37_25535 [Candidatus Dormibacteraeota bacterium]|nr:hypothetical protein [Candidatus Dormibacteraeota bacterium]
MKNQTPTFQHGVPDAFLNKFGRHVTGILCGFDRLLFQANIRVLFNPKSMEDYLLVCKVLIKHFKAFAEGWTNRVKSLAYQAAERAGRPVRYLQDPGVSKEELARSLAREDRVEAGLIALFTAVETCWSYSVRGDRQSKEIHLVLERRKCTHLYHYYQHPDFGLMHVRVQTWFPFSVSVCLNGREWLARQMDRAGLTYEQRDNCFVKVSDCQAAQALLDQQLQSDWAALLNPLLRQAHPLAEEIGRPINQGYYWSARQTEYATDLLFKDAPTLAALYPQFLHHGIRSFASPDVLRFLGRACPNNFRGEVTSTLKRRPEGVRLRHTVNGNSIKVYDKQGSVLRVETTVVNPREFKVYRPVEKDPEAPLRWQRMRYGVADLYRRAQVSHGANARYLEALASVTGKTPLGQEVAEVCRRITVAGQRFRALNPWSAEDAALLEVVNRGEFALAGLRNRDLRTRLYPGKRSPEEDRRRAAKITRKLALLRAHGLLKKVSGTHRYQLTDNGRRIVTALLAARQADVDQLTQLAA